MLRNSRGEGQGGRGERAAVPPAGLWRILSIHSDLCFFLVCVRAHVFLCAGVCVCVLHNHRY